MDSEGALRRAFGLVPRAKPVSASQSLNNDSAGNLEANIPGTGASGETPTFGFLSTLFRSIFTVEPIAIRFC